MAQPAWRNDYAVIFLKQLQDERPAGSIRWGQQRVAARFNLSPGKRCWQRTQLCRLLIAVGMLLSLWSVTANECLAENGPQTRLGSVDPPAVQAGIRSELLLGDVADLDDPVSLWCAIPGWNAERHPASLAGPIDTRRFTVMAPPATAAGWYDIALVGRYGASALRRIRVEAVSIGREQEPNDLLDQANALPLNQPIYGTIERPADVDRYTLDCRDNQRTLVIRCEAEMFGSTLQPLLQLYDDQDRRLAVAGRAFQGNTLLALQLPQPGRYRLTIADFALQGTSASHYRLFAGFEPTVLSIWPPVAKIGETRSFQLQGYNLNGERLNSQEPLELLHSEIAIPTGTTPDFLHAGARLQSWNLPRYEFSQVVDGNAAPPVPIYLTDANVQLVHEPPAKVDTSVNVPFDLVSTFDSLGDRDQYTFTARKGDSFHVEVFAARYGSPIDPVLLIEQLHDEQGQDHVKQIALADEPVRAVTGAGFVLTHDDPAVEFTAPVNGPYRITVFDRLRSSDRLRRRYYRLAVHSPRPNYELLVLPAASTTPISQTGKTLNLSRHGSSVIQVWIDRQQGFDSPLILEATGLPPGVTSEKVQVLPSQHLATLRLTADETATPGIFQFQVIGRSHEPEPLRRKAVVAVKINLSPTAAAAYCANVCQLSVDTQQTRFRLEGQSRSERHIAGSTPLFAIAAVREPDFLQEVNIAPAFLEKDSQITVPATKIERSQSRKLVPIAIDRNAPAAVHEVLLVGTAKQQIIRFPGWNQRVQAVVAQRENDLAKRTTDLQQTAAALAALKTTSPPAPGNSSNSQIAASSAVDDAQHPEEPAATVPPKANDLRAVEQAFRVQQKALKLAQAALNDARKVESAANAVAAPFMVDLTMPAPPLTIEVVKMEASIAVAKQFSVTLERNDEVAVEIAVAQTEDTRHSLTLRLEQPIPIEGLTAEPVDVASGQSLTQFRLVSRNAVPGSYQAVLRATFEDHGPVYYDLPMTIVVKNSI